MEYLNRFNRGQTLVELLLAVGLAALLIPTLLSGFMSSRESRVQQQQRADATAHLLEIKSAVRSVREQGWTKISTNGVYHPVASGSAWALAAGTETINGLTRSMDVSDVYRDAAGAIVSSGGTLDPSTKKITMNVTWSVPYSTNTSSVLYLTRWLENDTYLETTETHFNAGTKTGVVVQASNPPQTADDGEIILGAGGHSNWCTPALDATTVDLPKTGVANALYAIEGSAYATTGENASGVSFAKINPGSSPPYPPVPSLADTFDGYKTNGVYGEPNYAYISTDNNSKEGVIINLNSVVGGKYQEAGYMNAPGSGSGKSIFVVNNVGYLTQGNKLHHFDLSSKSGSRPLLDPDGVTLAGTANGVWVVGNYAYIATSSTSTQLQIVDLSNPSSLSVVGQASLAAQGGVDVHVNSSGTRAYVATAASGSQGELFIVDVSTKTGARPTIGSYEANGLSPNALTSTPANRLVLVGSGGEEYQVIDISNESSPSRCGGVNLDSGINDVVSVLESDNDAFSYILAATNPEFRIIEGGPGGSYATTGIFESQTFNPGYRTANNRLISHFAEPAGTEIRFQVSLASLTGGVCPTTGNYTFVGPDGTSATYFTLDSGDAAIFPFASYQNYSNPGQCFRYKAFITTTNQSNTPVLNDVTINYSP